MSTPLLQAPAWLPDHQHGRHAPAIGICGSYGGLNVGDEAILTVAVDQIRNAVPGAELTVFTRDVRHTVAHHDANRVIDTRGAMRDELIGELQRLDVLLLGGGGILYDDESQHYLQLPRLAQALGVCTATCAIGAGPLNLTEDRRAVASVLNEMALITVRDHRSRRLLEDVGVEREIAVTADPAVLLKPAPTTTLVGEPDRPLVGLSVREPGGAAAALEDGVYHRLLAHAADFVADRFDADLVFVPMERQDVRHSHRVIAEMGLPERVTVLRPTLRPREVLAVMNRLDLAVGMRLHFVIFAALANVPVLALPYASKVTSFLERIGIAATPLIESGHAGPLLAAIDRLWDLRHDCAAGIASRLPPLQQEARRTFELIAELLPKTVEHASSAPA
jgi:polysaccharide pyruvyl transferase CsaB